MDHRKKYDYAVIGAGLTGTIIAKGLSRQGAKVLLLEATEIPGEFSGMTPLPDTAENLKNLEFFQLASGLSISIDHQEFRLKTYDSGQVKEFLGFGIDAPEYVNLMLPFLAAAQLSLEPAKESWLAKILADYTGDFEAKSYVTAFEFEGSKIKSFLINGQTRATADQIVFAGDLPQLSKLVPVEHWSPKNLSKFGKMRAWTAVGLDLTHQNFEMNTTDSENSSPELWMLKGTPQDLHAPCVGFIAPDGETSQWMTWIKDIDAEDTEEVGSCLKRIKRQIKQAFPELLTKIDFERIYIQPAWAITSPNFDMLPNVTNLQVASSQLAKQPGILGAVERATVVLKEMGFTETSFPELQIQGAASESPNEDRHQEMVDAPL